jgi:hypothetical protein
MTDDKNGFNLDSEKRSEIRCELFSGGCVFVFVFLVLKDLDFRKRRAEHFFSLRDENRRALLKISRETPRIVSFDVLEFLKKVCRKLYV